MFAPNHHPAMKNVAPVRREMGVRTMFNILGPLTNPAGAPNTLMGVFHPDLVGIQVRVMQRLGAKHVLVVYGKDGMDEVSLGAATLVGELKDGKIREYEIHPEDFGLPMMSNRGLKVADAAESKAMLLGRARQPAGRRRARSSPSTPAPRCTPPTWPTPSAPASSWPAKFWPAAPRAPSSTSSSPAPRSSPDPPGKQHVRHPQQDPRRQARGSRRRPRAVGRSDAAVREPPRPSRRRAISSAPSAPRSPLAGRR
jgi:hypothetical protein